MTTFTVQIKDDVTEMVFSILKKFKGKVVVKANESKLTLEIAEALKEIKQIQEGKIKPLTIEDI